MTKRTDPSSDLEDSSGEIEPGDAEHASSGFLSFQNRLKNGLSAAGDRFKKIFLLDQAAHLIAQWFGVSEAQVAEILETVRAELPTTEAILIGKPQSGKSSIVRGITGISAEIVGQGFRPHTQYTQRYTYPTNDIPLLIFTDTVGLGDSTQATQSIIAELTEELQHDRRRARILLLTVKITDFAIDSLKDVAQQIRQAHPAVPCLLVVTCLHEAYPPGTDNHPDYPPNFESVSRAFTAIQEDFREVCDRAILLDFTLEEDEYSPVFYGIEALRDALTELLPEAESRTIHQLLDDEAGKKLGDLYRDTGRRYILPFSVTAATVAAIPLPFATMPVLTALQGSMVVLLGQLYGQTLSPAQAGGIVSAIAGGFLAQAIAREVIKFIPGFGSVIAASWAAAYTWALGEATCVYFGDLIGGKKPDPKRIQQVMKDSFASAKERFKNIKNP
jgi:uncharacterized protein (DUF697 family)